MRELAAISEKSPREVQRVIKSLQNEGRIRKLSKSERRISFSGWHPDEKIYRPDFWHNHTTDLRISVYIIAGDAKEIRAEVDEMLKSVGLETSRLLTDIIMGKYMQIDPLHSDAEKLEKLSRILPIDMKNEYVKDQILDLCEKFRGHPVEDDMMEPVLKSTKMRLNSKGLIGRFVYLFIKEAFSKVDIGEIRKMFELIREINESELHELLPWFEYMVRREGFSNFLNSNRTAIMETAFRLTEREIPKGLVDQLLELLNPHKKPQDTDL
ncbi:MAG: hypothetical protein QXU18_02370 [Thermoplasmatales archaeon]